MKLRNLPWIISLFCCRLALASSTGEPSGFQQPAEDRAIEHVKHMPVSKLDSALPDVMFAAWFERIVGKDAKVRWEMNDCGEQTADPKIDRQNDAPVCVGAYADMPDGRKVVVLLNVGTVRKGAGDAARVFDAYLEVGGKQQQAKRLHNLEDSLKR